MSRSLSLMKIIQCLFLQLNSSKRLKMHLHTSQDCPCHSLYILLLYIQNIYIYIYIMFIYQIFDNKYLFILNIQIFVIKNCNVIKTFVISSVLPYSVPPSLLPLWIKQTGCHKGVVLPSTVCYERFHQQFLCNNLVQH